MNDPLEYKIREYWIQFSDIEKALNINGHLTEIHVVNKHDPDTTEILIITRNDDFKIKKYWRSLETFKENFSIEGDLKDIAPVNTDTIDGEEVYIKTEEKLWGKK